MGLTATFPLDFVHSPFRKTNKTLCNGWGQKCWGYKLINRSLQTALFWKFSLRVNVTLNQFPFSWQQCRRPADFCPPKWVWFYWFAVYRDLRNVSINVNHQWSAETRRVLTNTPLSSLASSFWTEVNYETSWEVKRAIA